MTNPKKPALRLRVGGVYETRNGVRFECVEKTTAPAHPYVCKTPSGSLYCFGEDGEHRSYGGYDLIREVSAPRPARKSPRKAAKPTMAWGLERNGKLQRCAFPTREIAGHYRENGETVVRVEVRR